MARRMSNRDRIDRMRAEAAATERDKEKKRAEKAARAPAGTRSPKPPADVRRKLVWAVKDPGGEVLCTYPYPRRDLAEAEAARRHTSDGRSYIVTPEKVPFEA